MILLITGLIIGLMFGFLLGRHFELKVMGKRIDESIQKCEDQISKLSLNN